MMQMLAAGGMPVLTDGERTPDDDNPRGYFEWERIKQLPKQPALIDLAEGRAVKCISQLLLSLPSGRSYRIIFMQRPLAEVLASQAEMLRRRGVSASGVDDFALSKAFQNHLRQVDAWFNSRPEILIQRLDYHEVLRDPLAASQVVQQFLELPLEVNIMAAEVVPALYRQRKDSNS